MTTSCRNLHSTFHCLLPFYISKVQFIIVLVTIKLLSCIYFCGLNSIRMTVQKVNDLLHCICTINLQFVDDSSLANILLRHDKSFVTFLTRHYGYRQGPTNRQQCTIETEFSNHHKFLQTLSTNFTLGRHNTNGDWQVISRTLLLQVGRSEVDGNILNKKAVTAVLYGCHNSLIALLHCIVR